MEYILQTKATSKDFSGKMAIDYVSIKVGKGDICGFIGENDAGKTTLMRMVCGLARCQIRHWQRHRRKGVHPAACGGNTPKRSRFDDR
ncbi:MAG: ATP-binding cassette domain-containing protein [Oscillospiraceae bacterium]|nr:ATP-binding cassette domain-containing protein [Oscillospiraceae bacterium]